MKIFQSETTFQPITIVLETREETEAMLILTRTSTTSVKVAQLLCVLCNFFENEAKL
jgi:hypothetical protein